MSSLNWCLAVAGYWSMATIVSTLPAASALPAATQPSSGDFNELTDLAKTPQADCERCYYLYAFRLMFPIPNRYTIIGDSARKNGCASFVSPPDQLLEVWILALFRRARGRVRTRYAGHIGRFTSIRPSAHIFVGSKADWYTIADDLPQHHEHELR